MLLPLIVGLLVGYALGKWGYQGTIDKLKDFIRSIIPH